MLSAQAMERATRRFWSKVNRKGPDECWVWLGSRFISGYGQYVVRGGDHGASAHRFSMVVHLGRDLRDGEHVLHKCDNPPCVNPRHLFLGNSKINSMDMISKGRHVYGERAIAAKLTSNQVVQLVAIYNQGGVTYADLAAQFGISKMEVGYIIRGKSWGHLKIGSRKDHRRGRKMPPMNRGSASGRAKLRDKDIAKIIKMRSRGMLFKDIARRFGVCGETIASIFRGRSWQDTYVSCLSPVSNGEVVVEEPTEE